MRTFLLLNLFLILACPLFAQAPKGKATPGMVYGEKITERDAMPAGELPMMLSMQDTVEVKIMAKVINSCASEGCWLTFRINDSTEALAKMKNHAFFVPIDIRGKSVIMQGRSYIKTSSVKELKHLAEDAKKTKKEIDAITQPKKQIIYIASSVMVVEP